MLNQDDRRQFNEIAHHLCADREFIRRVQESVPVDRPPFPVARVLLGALPVAVLLMAIAVGGWTAVVPALALLMTILAAIVVLRRDH